MYLLSALAAGLVWRIYIDMQSSFLLHLTNHGIRKGFSRLYMTSGEGDARLVPLFPVDHDNSAAITDHAHICKFNRFKHHINLS